MNSYEQIARNLYTDNMKAASGADLGVKQYLDYMHKSADPNDYGVIFYSSVLVFMSRSELSHLKPALAKMVKDYCHEMLVSIPQNDQKENKSDIIPLVIMHYYLSKIGGIGIGSNVHVLAGKYGTTHARLSKEKRLWNEDGDGKLSAPLPTNQNSAKAILKNLSRAIELLKKENDSYRAVRLAADRLKLLEARSF